MSNIEQSKSFIFSQIDNESKQELPIYLESDSNNPDIYIKFGVNNTYPNLLQALTEESATVSSIVNGTVNFIAGAGVLANNLFSLNPNRINRYGETIEDLVRQMAHDLFVYDGCYVQVIKNKLHQISELYILPFEMVRCNYNKTKFWFSKKWTKYSGGTSSKTIIYDAYDSTDETQHTGIIYYSNNGHRSVYPKSPLTSIINDMNSEIMCQKFIKNSLEGGLAARYIISLPNCSNLSDEQKDAIRDGIKANMCGVENASAFAMYFNNGEKGLEIQKVDLDNAPEMFTTLRNALRENIFIGCHATPQLFGMAKEGTGFDNVEYQSAYALYNKQTVVPIQHKIKRIFEGIFGVNGVIDIEPYNTNLENNIN